VLLNYLYEVSLYSYLHIPTVKRVIGMQIIYDGNFLKYYKICVDLTKHSIRDRRSRKMDCSSVRLRIPRSQVPSLQSTKCLLLFNSYLCKQYRYTMDTKLEL
jgi:hypothetical protein